MCKDEHESAKVRLEKHTWHPRPRSDPCATQGWSTRPVRQRFPPPAPGSVAMTPCATAFAGGGGGGGGVQPWGGRRLLAPVSFIEIRSKCTPSALSATPQKASQHAPGVAVHQRTIFCRAFE
eukprot:COSAG03_NODE_3261_length_2119_cov_49.190594_2_plen_122_part_00